MSLFHAVVFIDHHNAQILRFTHDTVVKRQLHSHEHYTRQHGSGVHSEHEFFAAVCDELADVTEVLVTGGHTGLADFRHYVEKHRPLLVPRIIGYEVVGTSKPSELSTFARDLFLKHDQLAGIRTTG